MASKQRKAPRGVPPARLAALDALTRCLHKGADIQSALDVSLQQVVMDPRDVGLATELSYGTLRLKGRLDHLLSSFLTKPGDLPPALLLALCVAAYEMTSLDKVPAYASVDWAVNYVKSAVNPRLAKLANAVLRNVDRLGEDAVSPDYYRADAADEAQFLSRYYACPQWIVRLWLDAYGLAKTTSLLLASIQAPPVGYRFDLHSGTARGQLTRLQDHADCVGRASTGLAFSRVPAAMREAEQSGLASRQSLAGQQAMLGLDAAGWERPLWDACAGRGGKTFLARALGAGTIVASDPNKGRLRGLRRQVDAAGYDDVHPVRARADRTPPFCRKFPTILVDAPCSGLGVMSRRPDSKYKRRPQDITRLAVTQAAILDQASAALEPGGTLVYLTCTVCPAENEDQIASFLAAHPGMSVHKTFATPQDSPLREFFWGAVLR